MQSMRNYMTVLSAAAWLVAGAAWAGADDPPAKVKAIVDRAAAVKSYHENLSMTMEMMGSKMSITGEMWAEGGKMRMEMLMPPVNAKQITIAAGDVLYTVMPTMNMVQKMDILKIKAAVGDDFVAGMGGAQGPGASTDPFQGVNKDKLVYVGQEKLGELDVDVVEGEMAGGDSKMRETMGNLLPTKVKYWVAVSDGMPRKVVYLNAEGKEMFTQEFSNVEVDIKNDPALFQYQEQEGAKVMDMTDGVISMYQGMSAGVKAAPVAMPPTQSGMPNPVNPDEDNPGEEYEGD